MIRIALRILIRRPAAEVFAFTADLEQMPRWAAGPVSCRRTSPSPPGPGMTYEITARPPIGPAMRSTYTITAYEAGRSFAGDGSFGPIPFSETYLFAPAPEGTRLSYRVELHPAGALRLVSPLLKLPIRALIRSDLRRLKRLLESGDAGVSEPSTG